MSFTLPADVQAVLVTWRTLVQDPMVWWEVGVLVLAAAGALLVHRVLSQGLLERTEQNTEYAMRHLALRTLQRILLPISMLMGVLVGRALCSIKACRWVCSIWRYLC